MKTLLKTAAVTAALFASATASATTIDLTSWVVNGHTYKLVETHSSLDWTDAKSAAESSTYLGQNGYLATFTSAAEYDFVYSELVSSFNQTTWGWAHGPWVGGYKDGNAWAWVSGETFTDIGRWLPSQPSGNGLYMHIAKNSNSETGLDDVPNDGYTYNTAYIVEYDVSAVPVPAAAFLFAPALVGFMGLRRRAAKKA
jgi:hypothetical protein